MRQHWRQVLHQRQKWKRCRDCGRLNRVPGDPCGKACPKCGEPYTRAGREWRLPPPRTCSPPTKPRTGARITAHFDGSCEPINPGGTASAGAVVFVDGTLAWEHSDVYEPAPGEVTSNNVAEYAALLAVLRFLIEQGWQDEPTVVCGDSMLVIRQMQGLWRIKSGFYASLAHEALALIKNFSRLRFQWVPRAANACADRLSRQHQEV